MHFTREDDGSSFYARVVMADDALEEGTPLTKETLLQDETAAMFGLDNTAVPNDIFWVLRNALLKGDTGPVDVFGNKVSTQIVTGSYIGTGTYGADNPNSLTLPFAPKMVIVMCENPQFMGYMLLWNGGPYGMNTPENPANHCVVSVNDKTVSWYCAGTNTTYTYQCNVAGETYRYIAIS